MKKKTSNLNIKSLLDTNMYIFKENMRIIYSQSFDLFWQTFTAEENLDNYFLKEVYAQDIDVIVETEEDKFKSGLSSEKSPPLSRYLKEQNSENSLS